MRTSCCATLAHGQCHDCPLTAPMRPTSGTFVVSTAPDSADAVLRAILACNIRRQNAKKPWAINKPWYTVSVPRALLERAKAIVGDCAPFPDEPETEPHIALHGQESKP